MSASTDLRGSTVEIERPERRTQRSPLRGSIRVRFLLGAALLLLAVLVGLVETVARHERSFLVEQTQNTLRTMIETQAELIELALPPQAETIDLATLSASALDATALLRFQALMDDLADQGLEGFAVADREGIVLLSLDPRQVGTPLYDSGLPQETAMHLDQEDVGRIDGVAPVHNGQSDVVGAVRLAISLAPIERLVRQTRTLLWLIGGSIAVAGLILSWVLIAPVAHLTQQLTDAAQRVVHGESILVSPRRHPLAWLAERSSLRLRLTAALVLSALLLVVAMQTVVVPTERRHLEHTLQGMLAGVATWLGQTLSAALEGEDVDLAGGQVPDGAGPSGTAGRLDLGKLQELGVRLQGQYGAYVAVADSGGVIRYADQTSLIGKPMPLPTQTEIGTERWRDREIWTVSTPLWRGPGGEQIGALRFGVRRDTIDAYLSESRTLFRLAGLILALGSALLAQAIGAVLAAPVQHLADGVRRVGQGDLNVQFEVHTVDELAVLARAFNQMVAGLREREWLRDMFGRFVSPEIAEAIRSGQVRLEGEHRVVSVLFCDIRDFTQRSAHHSPAEMVALLNEYLSVVVTAAQRHGGTVNKFGGDSTLIIYGAPRQLYESAYQAVLTALDMSVDLARLNRQLVARGEDPIRIGVGINTGLVLAGAVGPTARQEYTVIGDTVNLASRIEGLNKLYPMHEVLIGEPTYEALGRRRSEFALVDLGEIEIRGKDEPVRVWAVRGRNR